jgi:dihydroorotate dehydrogenase
VRWRNPVGLAAGLDKDGVAIPFWAALGFGAVEVGTVTAHPQPGNPRPRLFRLVDERAIVNRMGFNNLGSEALARRLDAVRGRVDLPVGANVGKSKITPPEGAVADYVLSAQRLRGRCDWLTVNVSSPNTPGLRDLQDAEVLARLLPAVVDAFGGPVFLKLAPDLVPEAVAAAAAVARSSGVAAIVAANTTLRRDVLARDPQQAGGLSGAPLYDAATPAVAAALASGLPVVAAGGVGTPERVAGRLDAGCAAVQVYTAFVYEGPGLADRLVAAL